MTRLSLITKFAVHMVINNSIATKNPKYPKIMNVQLGGVPETLLITVRARAEETHKKNPLVKDPYAVDIVRKVDSGQAVDEAKRKVKASSQVGIVIRTEVFDNIVKEFAAENPDGVLVALGCGLDARYERLKPSCSLWYDLDVPEAIEARKLFFTEKENYKMLSCSMLDYSWMDKIPANKPLLIISEGVFMYFAEEDLKPLISEIFRRFPQARVAFDTIAPFLAKRTNLHTEVKKYNAQFKWGLDYPEDLKAWDSRIEIIKPYYYFDYHSERWPLSMKILGLLPIARRGNKVVYIRYNNSHSY